MKDLEQYLRESASARHRVLAIPHEDHVLLVFDPQDNGFYTTDFIVRGDHVELASDEGRGK